MNQFEFNHLTADSLDEALSLVGDSFVYKGVIYHGIINEVEFEVDYVTGGQLQKLGAIIVAPKRSLKIRPNIGDTLIIDGVTMRVERVKSDTTAFEITCVTAAV